MFKVTGRKNAAKVVDATSSEAFSSFNVYQKNVSGKNQRHVIHTTLTATLNKSSTVSEMGDRDHNIYGPKRGALLCPFH